MSPPQETVSLVAQVIAFLSAERHKVKNPARYAGEFEPHFIDEATRVLAALDGAQDPAE